MNINEGLKFAAARKAEGHRSDGCTLAPDLGIAELCEMHDMLRRFEPVTAFEADNLFFKGVRSKGLRYLPIACIYWLFARVQSLHGTAGTVFSMALVSFIAIIYFNS